MTPHTLAHGAYAQAATPIRTPRGTEYELIARITHRIKATAKKGRPGFPELAEAVHDNRQLWTILATDVADIDNPLPKSLRARIFYLAEFTHIHSGKVLRENASVRPLLEVNTAILRGLRNGISSK
ncbi:flagellar protein FlaF [Salinihabitans flavidus]|uniref:Flagellar protein FlaF n=1 Tax=Salinihabitans flavidus TaxID=569882 RepID=A0A1H8LPP8_9RHOB|nr:flagellar biosynthesis regulator FlaF [Salinihabitans flavidus]SEO07087.1 flagellar protein FlaF [Salinihabitans flavidus]